MLDVLAADRNLQSVIKETKPMLRMRIEELVAYEHGYGEGGARRLPARFEEREVAGLTGLDPETVRRLGGDARH